MFALADCNNFFASCERVFRPELNGKPVIVLSNNDGCAVARSNEAKALGIKMGAPFFQIKDLVEKNAPNSLSKKDVEDGKTQVYWELKGSVDGHDALITSDCTPQFAQYLMPKGNPGFQHWEFYEVNSDGDEVFRAYDTYWEPGATAMPAKGAYHKFAATKSGTLRVGIYGNKNANPTYIVDESTRQPLAPSTIDVSIYYQNTGFAYEGSAEEGTAKYFNVGKMADDYVLQHTNGVTQNRPVLGFIDFSVEAGKTYWLFNPKSQIGIYGFYFQAGGESGISNVKAELDADAPVYNLAGQKVSNDFKGVVIQNGKKFVK